MNKIESDSVWELVVKKLHNSLSSEEAAEFDRIKDTEEAQKKLRQARQIYSKSSNSFYIRKIDKEKNWKYIHNQISSGYRIKGLFIYFSRYAAVFLVALIIGILVHKVFIPGMQDVANNRIEMEWGQMGKMTLSDGTKVWLNAGTVFEYPATFNTRKRSVKLTGEAQFNVTGNEEVPFEVKTKSGIVKVYGTIFNVAAYEDEPTMAVTLIEGKVTVESNEGNLLATLHPSEQLLMNKFDGSFSIQKVDTDFYTNWIDGKLLLNETKLSDLIKILKRWYNLDIKLMDEETGDIKISGTIIKNKPLDLFLKILERMYGVEYELIINKDKKDEILIYKK